MKKIEQSKKLQYHKDKKRILIAEDEFFWFKLLELQLTKAQPNIEIIHVKNGEEAVDYIKESKEETNPNLLEPDAFITDIQMPIMDGATAVRIIRDLLYIRPIIVWSAYRDSAENLKKSLDIPVNGFCVKEGSLENLLTQLKNLKIID